MTADLRGDNFSRHSPIMLSLRLGEIALQTEEIKPPPPRMPAWDRATPEELTGYTAALHQRLQSVQPAVLPEPTLRRPRPQ